MKKAALLFGILGFAMACKPSDAAKTADTPQQESQSVAKAEANFDWLVGNWNRSNEEDGVRTHEIWKKENPNRYLGTSYSLRGKDTIWKEEITLSPLNSHWTYQVFLPLQNQECHFRLTHLQGDSFVVENPENDFPQRISYQKVGEEIHAEISTGEKIIPYVFVPIR